LEGALNKIGEFLRDDRQHYIALPYADFWVQAQKDSELKSILNQADLSLSDGVGPVLASYLLGGEKLKNRVMGVDLVWALFEKFGEDRSFFLFGGKENVASEAAKNILKKIPKSKIAGTRNGYIDSDRAIEEINEACPEILLVALGLPKQEKWIYNNLTKMPSVKLAIGVGGAFDFISGQVRRAPKIIQKMGLEWLWRLFLRPSQWRKAWRSVIIFSGMVIKNKAKLL